jgi:hypothetical protein
MFRSNKRESAMKRLTWIRAIVLGLAVTTASVGANSDERSVTAAATGLFAAGAELGPVALQGLQIATGVFIEADGSASGTFHATLQGSSLGGSPQEITVEGNVTGGSVDADGRATFSGSASLNLGDGTPPLANVAFSVTAGSDDLVLVVDTVQLTASLPAGAITID